MDGRICQVTGHLGRLVHSKVQVIPINEREMIFARETNQLVNDRRDGSRDPVAGEPP